MYTENYPSVSGSVFLWKEIFYDMLLIFMLLTLYISYTARFGACHVTALTNHYTASIW